MTEKLIRALLDFFGLCIVFTVAFGLVIGGGILFFRLIYWTVS